MDSRYMKEFNIMEIRNRDEEIRLKNLKEMTIEDALYTILRVINDAHYYPCGYSHTIQAYEILNKEIKKGL